MVDTNNELKLKIIENEKQSKLLNELCLHTCGAQCGR